MEELPLPAEIHKNRKTSPYFEPGGIDWGDDIPYGQSSPSRNITLKLLQYAPEITDEGYARIRRRHLPSEHGSPEETAHAREILESVDQAHLHTTLYTLMLMISTAITSAIGVGIVSHGESGLIRSKTTLLIGMICSLRIIGEYTLHALDRKKGMEFLKEIQKKFPRMYAEYATLHEETCK